MQEFAKQRSAEASRGPEAQQREKLEQAEDYTESLRLRENGRRLFEAANTAEISQSVISNPDEK